MENRVVLHGPNGEQYFKLNNHGYECHVETFKFGKSKLSVFGVLIDGRFISPNFGPFSDFEFSAKGSLSNYSLVDGLIKNIESKYRGYEFTICPEFYGMESALLICSLLSSGAKIVNIDLDNYIDLRFKLMLSRGSVKKLRQLKEAGFKVRESNFTELPLVYQLLSENRASKGRNLSLSYQRLEELYKHFSGSFKIWSVVDSKETFRASAVTIDMNKFVRYVFYWGDRECNDSYSPVVLLADHLVEESKQSNFQFLDLGTSTNCGSVDIGLHFFKRSLGAIDTLKIRIAR